MAKKLLGMEAADSLNDKTKTIVSLCMEKGIVPTLSTIRIGENAADLYYETMIDKACDATGIVCKKMILPEQISQQELLKQIHRMNEDPDIHGIFLYRPFVKGLDCERVENAVSADKDVDGMTNCSLAGVFAGKEYSYASCVSDAARKILEYADIDLNGKNVVVIGRSLVTAKSIAMLLIRENATVTICHTKTKDMPSITRKADILIAATGFPHLIGSEYVREGQIIVDMGMNCDREDKICGDVNYKEAEPIAGAITPVPGGIGPLMSAVLMQHVAEAAKRCYPVF